jgi:group I intron endonuclease
MISGIYSILCITGKRYIGSAAYIDGRWKTHRWALARGKHHSQHLQRAWDRHGKDAFSWEVLEYVEPARLIEREQHYLDLFQAANPKYGFNISPTARSVLGTKHSEETKRKMSLAHKGKKPSPEAIAAMKGRKFSAEHRRNLSLASRGRKLSAEACANIAAAQCGKKLSAEHVAKIVAANTGRIPTFETRAKLAAAMTPERKAKMAASLQSPEVKAKIRASHLGKRKSEEHREKLSAHLRSPEHRAKVSSALKGNQHTLGKPLSPEHRAKIAASQCERNHRRKAVAARLKAEQRAQVTFLRTGIKPTVIENPKQETQGKLFD